MQQLVSLCNANPITEKTSEAFNLSGFRFRCVLFVVPAKMYHRRIEATACNEPQCFEPWVCSNATVSVSLISGKYLNCLSEVIHIHTFALLFSSMTMIEELSNASFRAILDHIQTHFADFLRMPHYKQTNLAEKAVTELVKHQHEPYKYCPQCIPPIYCIFIHDLQGLTYFVIHKKH